MPGQDAAVEEAEAALNVEENACSRFTLGVLLPPRSLEPAADAEQLMLRIKEEDRHDNFRRLEEIAIETILIFGAFFVIGTFLRAQAMGGHVMKLLIFFAVVALAGGGLAGAYFLPHTPGAARHNQSAR